MTPRLRGHLAECDICRAEVERRRAALAELDAELASALRVEASPELLARVRRRVEASPSRSRPIFGWRLAVAAASLALVVLAAALSLLGGPAAPQSPRLETIQAATAPDTRVAPPTEPRPLPSPAPRPLTTRRVATAVAVKTSSAEPEVLVPASQRLAIRELMQMLRAGTLDEKILAEPKAITHSDVSVTPIVVEEVAVPEITIRGGSERRP